MVDIDKYPFLYGEDNSISSAIIEIINDETIEEEDKEHYVLALLSPENHSHYKKWKYGEKRVTFMQCPKYEEIEREDEEENSLIYSLVEAENAPLVIEIFQNNTIPDYEKLEIVRAIVGEDIFEKIEGWKRRDVYKEAFLMAMKPGLRSLIEGKLEVFDYSSVQTLLKAATVEARENYEKWRSSTTGVPTDCSYLNQECFTDNINIVVVSDEDSIYQFLAFLARMVVFSPQEHFKYREIKTVDWKTNDLFYYNLSCDIDRVQKSVRLIPIGMGTSFMHKSKIPDFIEEIHGVIEYITEFPSDNRKEDLSNILKSYFETTPTVETLIIKREKEGAFSMEHEGDEYECLGIFHYYNSLKQGILSDSTPSSSTIQGLSVLAEEVKRMFNEFANNSPFYLKNRDDFVEVVYENQSNRPDGNGDKTVFGYNEIFFKCHHPFTFMELDDNDCDIVVERL